MASNHDTKLNQTIVQKNKQPKQIGDFIIGKVLGEGTFGKVRLAVHKHTNQKVAIKFLEKNKISEVADVERVTREIHILKLIRHPNLVQLYQIIQTPKQLLLIMQFMEKGQLFDYIVKNKRINEQEARKMFHQLIDSIEYIHKLKIAHRDLKPQNILLNYNKSLKIVDFGLGNTYKQGQLLKTPCGSPCYAAPEMIQGQRYEPMRIDIWSSGIILFAMVNGYLPFEDQNTNELYKKVLTGVISFHDSVSSQAKDLIKKILNNNPKQRYTIQQIRKHPWMQKYKGKKSNDGIVIGYNKIPIDQQILKQLTQYGTYDLDYVQTCLEANRHNQATVTYYLSMKKHIKAGGMSKYDFGNQNFDRKSIQPVKRKQHRNQIMIDNFFTKNSCGTSTELPNNVLKKLTKNKLSKQKQQNKENIGLFMNKNKSKQKFQKNSKDRSRDNMKIAFKQQNLNVSHMLNSVNGKSSKLKDSVEKRSQSLIKKIKSGSSMGKIQKKVKPSRLDGSLNYGRVPMIKSIEKNSGRQSEPHTESRNRENIMENRVARKYQEQFNQSLISKSKGKIKTQTQRQRQRQRPRINSSVNQSINGMPNTYQGFNTTTITNVNTYSGHTLMNMSKKYKEHDSSTGFIEEYLTKGKKVQQKKLTGYLKSGNDSSKIIKPRKL